MTFTAPVALLLALGLPYLAWLGWPNRSPARAWREWFSLGLRLLIFSLLILSLAGAQLVRRADELAVVFLVDASDSIDADQAARAEAYVRDALAAMGPNDQAAVVVFGANALVDRPMSRLAELAPIRSTPQTLQTNLAEAIRLGLALFPAGSARRLVILSDGQATAGDSPEAARLAATSDVEISYVFLSRPAPAQEALLLDVTAPSRVAQGEAFTVNVTVESTADMPATLRVLAGGSIIYEQEAQLRPGIQRLPILLRATAPEFARYQVQLAPAADTYYQNNELAAFTEVIGPPRLLLVSDGGEPDEAAQLELALATAGLELVRLTPAELPASLPELSNYASIILANVNGRDLSPRKMAALQTYVRDLGGGLVMVGGPESFGMGGYFKTPVEEALPVNMQLQDQERFPSVSIVIVIDRSGSMGVAEGGVTKIQLANEAAVRVVELLNDFDDITVIPVDTQPSGVVGPVSAAERDAIIAQIRQIGAGGGGINVRTGMAAAADALAGSSNQVRHIIVLADGADSNEKEGVPALIQQLVDEDVTVSMVAIGNGPDVPWLQDMADLGNGRFHFTDRAANLPQIFTQETTAIQRSYLIEERFFPSAGPDYGLHPLMRGITQVPPLLGYVGTSAKGTAQILLESHLGDPLLAAWQYGLGRSVAWTSDATGRWANDWVRWSNFASFWAQTVRWTVSAQRDNSAELVVNYQGDAARLTIDARDGNGRYLNDLRGEASVVAPSGRTTSVDLAQVAPGRYEGQFTPGEEGAYLIRISATAGDEVVVGQTGGWVLGYSPEYQRLAPDRGLLARLAELTGGRELPVDETNNGPAAAFAHTRDSEPHRRPIWPWLTLAAVLLLPLDVGLRRLVLTRRDLARAWGALFGRWQPALATTGAERAEQVSRLFQAKERAGTARTPPPPETTVIDPPGAATREDDGEPARVRPAGPASPAAAPPDEPLAARLLARRRRDREDR